MTDKTLSRRHEREFAEVLPSGDQVAASGAKDDKHDVRTLQEDHISSWGFRYELKCTQRKSYSLKLADWQELVEYAVSHGERPAWAIRYYDPEYKGDRIANAPVKADLVAIDLNDYVELLEELETLRAKEAKPIS